MNMLSGAAARWFTRLVATAAMVGLMSACGGGGGNAGTPVVGPGDGGGSATVADLSVVLDKSSVSNSGADTVTVTVTSVDANRNTVGNVPVKVMVDNGAFVTPSGTNTNATTGQLTAAVQIGADRSNRTVGVTVTSGSISKKLSFDVVDSISGGKVADLAMVLGATSVPNQAGQTVALTVTSLDASRSAIGGSPVTLKVADPAARAFVAPGGAQTTDANGRLAAVVSLGSLAANRTITLTAVSGTVERSISFDVVDPTVVVPKASDISLLLDKTNVGNNGSDVVNVTVTAVDASRNVVAGIPVTFSVDNKANIAASGTLTNAQGQVTAVVRIGDDKSNRLITVTAKSETLVRTASFLVTGAKLQGQAQQALPAAGSTGNKVEYRLSDVNQNAMVGAAYTVSAPNLPTATGVTGPNGDFVYTYTAPTTPGPIDITAVAGGATSVVTVTVPTATSTVPPASPNVVSSALSASPTVVRVNTADTANRAEIRALFLAAGNVPVRNVRVRFDMNGDANNIGGSLSSGTSLVYSDANGAALTNYSPSQRSSPTDGVTIRACWDYNDFPATSCPHQVLTSLTVVADPLSVTIGTNDLIEDGSSALTYVKKYVLLVVDAAGNPKADVQITPSLDLTHYLKGFYRWNATVEQWTKRYLHVPISGSAVEVEGAGPSCQNEDQNRNGSIDAGDDLNGNGQLDPRKSDVSISMFGSTRTDANGVAILKIEYPKNIATWVAFRIQASAAGVLSPPAVYSSILPAPGAAVSNEDVPPAFQLSPYGLRFYEDGSTCSNPVQ
jgi:hypothetical protein